ncbi:MAG: NFACT RNA binding domain-containing protein [Eubacterium sp.]|nr:NFACT RNA binding domain-containing protein [Eubacterium sp.]
MAFDGITIAALVKELNTLLQDGHIQKIAQPEPDELLLTIKNNRTNYKLKLSASASLPLLHLTENPKPSPLTAPNFCMLLRKHLNGARVLMIEQIGLERVVRITLENLNELGDVVKRYLMIEIMGKHSNIIFVDDKNRIVDSIKHVNGMVSSVREVLPGREYFIPNTLNKQNPYKITTEFWNETLFRKPVSVAKMLYGSITGFSSTMAHELAYRSHLDGDAPVASLNGNDRSSLMTQYRSLVEQIKQAEFNPCIVFDGPVPLEFSAVSLHMYEEKRIVRYDSISKVIETFYGEKETISRIRQKSADLRKSVTTLLDRCHKKMDLQRKQVKDTEKKDRFRIYGELLNTYGYQLTAGDKVLTCINYYDNEEISIPVDDTLSASENANKYFNKYNKMKRTFEAVSAQMAENQDMIDHLESILTELDIARREEDLQYIRQELADCGYTKKQTTWNKKNHRMPKSKPLHFISSDGYDIYVGKNNYQNDELTFKMASGSDWWFHAKQMPGSHVIVKCHGEEPPIRTFEEAASLAAYFSKGKGAEKLEIDYTQKKNVKKPNGSRPGFVVYYTNYSLVASSHIEGIQCVNDEDSIFLERSYL